MATVNCPGKAQRAVVCEGSRRNHRSTVSAGVIPGCLVAVVAPALLSLFHCLDLPPQPQWDLPHVWCPRDGHIWGATGKGPGAVRGCGREREERLLAGVGAPRNRADLGTEPRTQPSASACF